MDWETVGKGGGGWAGIYFCLEQVIDKKKTSITSSHFGLFKSLMKDFMGQESSENNIEPFNNGCLQNVHHVLIRTSINLNYIYVKLLSST